MKTTCYVFIMAVLLFTQCNSENEEDLLPNDDPCVDNTATLSSDISVIIENNCALSGCHIAGTGRADFTEKENIIQNANQIRSFTQSGIMPPPESGRSLTDAQKQDIFCWVENGAQDN